MSEEPTLPPSQAGSVVLDLGGDIGVLVVHVDAALSGREIEISPVGAYPAHTHTDVRERRVGAHVGYAAVFPSLTAGDYVLDDPRGGPTVPVTITGGRVRQLDWRSDPTGTATQP